MEIAFFQPDRILVTLFASVLVAFVTAALSIVRLVNDKEGKTTDYRQAWTDSVRKSLADLVSNINAISGATVRRSDYVEQINAMLTEQRINKIEKLNEGDSTLHAHLDKQIAAEGEHIRSLRRDLHQSYALTRLHFKPNDLSFARIEQKFDVVVGMLEDIQKAKGETAKEVRLIIKEKIHAVAAEITGYARDILKTEWENVKRGEPAYQRTKVWSIVGGAVALVILLIFGAAGALSYFQNDTKRGSESAKSCTNSNISASVGVPLKLPETIQPQTSQAVNVHQVGSIAPTQRRSPPSATAVQAQPCVK